MNADPIATYSGCNPHLKYHLTSSGTITGATVNANSNTCSTPILVTVPRAATVGGSGAATEEVVGGEPRIKKITLSGSARSVTFGTAITL